MPIILVGAYRRGKKKPELPPLPIANLNVLLMQYNLMTEYFIILNYDCLLYVCLNIHQQKVIDHLSKSSIFLMITGK